VDWHGFTGFMGMGGGLGQIYGRLLTSSAWALSFLLLVAARLKEA